MEAAGVTFITGVTYKRVQRTDAGAGTGKRVIISVGGEDDEIDCDTLLVATGRAPNVNGMGLEKAGVAFDVNRGVAIDDHMRTSAGHIFAVGDVATDFKFTHVSGTMAQMVVDNALFDGDRRISDMYVSFRPSLSLSLSSPPACVVQCVY